MDEITIVCLSSKEDMQTDKYLQSKYKRMVKTTSQVFGVIDSKNCSEFFNESVPSIVTLSFVRTIFHNLFMRFGLYKWDKDTFMKFMDQMYSGMYEASEQTGDIDHTKMLGIKTTKIVPNKKIDGVTKTRDKLFE